MNEFESSHCLVCGADNYYPYSTKGQFGLPTHVVICKTCGFSYLNPRWTKERYHRFYTKEYDKYYRPEVINKNYSYDPSKSIKDIIARGKDIVDFSEPGLKILDIGAGMGDSLLHLKKELNPQAVYSAIESSDYCADNLRKNGIEVITQDVDSDWHLGREHAFDIIIMRHVLEHFLDPGTVLKKVRKVIKPHGKLYIGVPDAKNPTKPLLAHFFRVVHVSYFSVESLSNLLFSTGFSTLKIIDGDERERKEIFAFCSAADEQQPVFDSGEWIVQKKIYDNYRRKELYYRAKLIAAKFLYRLKR